MVIVIALWQLLTSVLGVPAFILPSPAAVGATIAGSWSVLASNSLVTLEETVVGFALALVIGVAVSMAMTLWKPVEDTLSPLVVLTQVIPKVAIAPLVVVYLGFGESSRIFLAFVIAFFPVIINTMLGLNSVEAELLELMATLGASRWQVMAKIRLRRAIPYIVEGSKITMTLAVIGAVVGEFSAGDTGLGYLIEYASSQIETSLAFASLVVLVMMGIVLYELVALVGHILEPKGVRKAEVSAGSRWTS